MPDLHDGAPARRRQWGSERRTRPLDTLHERPSERKLVSGRIAIILTIAFWLAYVVYTVIRQFLDYGTESFRFTTEAVSYLVVVTFLTFSALMHLVARQGAMERFATHVRVPRAELDRHFAEGHESPMTVLVPSYAEEPDVVATTLWSAALQEYPSLRVVLLIDDNPFPTDPETLEKLERTRAVARTIQNQLAAPSQRFQEALLSAEVEAEAAPFASVDGLRNLVEHHRWADAWLRRHAREHEVLDHVDHFFHDQVLIGLADEFRLTSEALEAAIVDAVDSGESFSEITSARALELQRRLAWTFTADITTFERKRYANLSDEANKAMNLNAYIGLLGGSYAFEETASGTILRTVSDPSTADLVVPASDYILTLDADSVLLRDYCLRLVYFLEQPENARVAVTQTPYSSFRGAATRIERLAGATTDIQHILHQGMSRHNATFWVGANAVIRTRALRDIEEVETVGGFELKRYVQDRTVIEDTESSVDLGMHGWTLVNYPERLSYSATPPDFGSLIVQRRRWANGGLLILPKYIRQVRERRARGERVGIVEMSLRVNYMASIAWASFGLIFLLAYPYDSRLLSPMVLLAALPYFWLLSSDLKYCGYKRTDVFRIYGFNLILMPVNVAGVLKSIQQALTAKKIPFARTPKVRDRTASPALYVLAPYAMVVFSVFTFVRDFGAQNWGNAVFAAFNALLAMYAIVAYIGIWNSVVDVWLWATKWMYYDPAARSARRDSRTQARADRKRARKGLLPEPEPATEDWRAVLYFGDRGKTMPVRHGADVVGAGNAPGAVGGRGSQHATNTEQHPNTTDERSAA
ncbi:cellulose synthase/poly-beta-1,6-N-acetylglucosamine synthase-like glycosyltransferase [Curtobacterium pusillum]|uniref:Cellulose synthase/poly-beta-1,6-N-acetylglucosamine synthase-like glycosyltransferase n=1 Tax=Curtobacterium pusillum TaxID=69373 RepID=A0AAW3T6E5_9MICO|nr:glycosyltransferase family 2 protein [Curtobacterium pusillum]MBA8989997.1 cellulose synthase/poly-beta-1,6-N-acetylglucosamine synthase-like glycosyltransferase [Curtobacterium pusillum]